MRIAVCPGSFDPVTIGHLDIISRASRIFDKIIVGVPVNPEKHFSFTVEERMDLLRRVIAAEGLENIEVDKVDGLLADYAKRRGAMVIVKGLRALSDFEYEFQQALTNKKLMDRGIRLISEIGGLDYGESCRRLFAAVEELAASPAPAKEKPSAVQHVLNGLRK